MKSEQTVRLKQNLSGLYDLTIEDKLGKVTKVTNLTFEEAIRVMEKELAKNEKRD